MGEALSERINPNLLSLFQSICNVFLPYTLNTKVLKLHSHVIIVDIYGADTFLASIPPNLQYNIILSDLCHILPNLHLQG